MDDTQGTEEKYALIKKPLRYYIVYDDQGQEVLEGTYYDILDELNINEQDFYNYSRDKESAYSGSYQIIEIIPDDEEDEIKRYYDCLLEIKNQALSYTLILKVMELCESHHYLEGLAKDDLQLGLFNYHLTLSIPEVVAMNLILQTYALLTISKDLDLDEIADYYKVPLWLVQTIDEHYDKTFEH